VIDRIAYLQADETDEAEQEELDTLLALQEDAEGDAEDWQHGVTLTRHSYFRDYAIELADDISAIPNNASWPVTCIDWDQAAREVQMDYTVVSFDGVTTLLGAADERHAAYRPRRRIEALARGCARVRPGLLR